MTYIFVFCLWGLEEGPIYIIPSLLVHKQYDSKCSHCPIILEENIKEIVPAAASKWRTKIPLGHKELNPVIPFKNHLVFSQKY